VFKHEGTVPGQSAEGAGLLADEVVPDETIVLLA
jgi:hypothetical protein